MYNTAIFVFQESSNSRTSVTKNDYVIHGTHNCKASVNDAEKIKGGITVQCLSDKTRARYDKPDTVRIGMS